MSCVEGDCRRRSFTVGRSRGIRFRCPPETDGAWPEPTGACDEVGDPAEPGHRHHRARARLRYSTRRVYWAGQRKSLNGSELRCQAARPRGRHSANGDRARRRISMTDKDHVFSRFRDEGPSSSNDRREQRIIPRRGGKPGSRVVEVVVVRSGGAIKPNRKSPGHGAPGLRAATWESGFPAKETARSPVPDDVPPDAMQDVPAPQIGHVMPVWERRETTEENRPTTSVRTATSRVKRATAAAAGSATPAAQRRVADSFDAHDDGANCLRCGYLIEPERDRQGLMTCAACG